MLVKFIITLSLSVCLSAPSTAQTLPAPPVAAKKPFQVTSPNGARTDNYYWLRDDTRKNPEMLAYLKAENTYADAALADTKPLQDTLFKEIVGRIKQDDSSVPYRKHRYYYYTRFATGADYPVAARRKGAMTAPEEVLLDQPKMAAGKAFFQIANTSVSPDDRLLAYAEDTVGRRQYVLRVKDIATGALLPDSVPNVEPNLVWSGDGRTIFYVEKDPVTLLSKRVKAHVLGTPASADRLVYEERDDSFYMGLSRTTDDRYICIGLQSTVSNEQRCAPAAAPATFTVLAPREREFRYEADHIGSRWIVRTNWNAPNYKLMSLDDAAAAKSRAGWTDFVPHDADVFVDEFKPFDGFVAIAERSSGNKRLRLLAGGRSSFVRSDEPAYTMAIGVNEEPGTPWLRYTYDSLKTPQTTYEVNARTGERRVLKVQPVPGYDPSKYVTERVWATARDGTRIPVSLFYAKGLRRDGTAAMLQYGYGSYGASMDPYFSPAWPSLLDRGMVYALAHIRGGQELGRKWYDDGHLMHKQNSFTDFVDVTRWLTAHGYAAKDRVAAMGGSAGGLLMGAVVNIAPTDYRAVVAQVPFVDVVTTMLDTSIPLTTNEFDEWGNPGKSKSAYDYMLSYSPYDNVRAQAYPALFVGTGLWDSQVQYYEPAKWVAKLRATGTGTRPLVFRVNMEAGHGGKSGRFTRLHENAEQIAFVLREVGATR